MMNLELYRIRRGGLLDLLKLFRSKGYVELPEKCRRKMADLRTEFYSGSQ